MRSSTHCKSHLGGTEDAALGGAIMAARLPGLVPVSGRGGAAGDGGGDRRKEGRGRKSRRVGAEKAVAIFEEWREACVRWMLREVGCRDVLVVLLSYWILRLWAPLFMAHYFFALYVLEFNWWIILRKIVSLCLITKPFTIKRLKRCVEKEIIDLNQI